jgi:hypothetical protein
MVASEIVTLFFYVISIAFLPEYFGKAVQLVLSDEHPAKIHSTQICPLSYLLALHGKSLPSSPLVPYLYISLNLSVTDFDPQHLRSSLSTVNAVSIDLYMDVDVH